MIIANAWKMILMNDIDECKTPAMLPPFPLQILEDDMMTVGRSQSPGV